MFTSRTTIRQYREMTRQRISSFYCKHAAELWQASLMCVLIDDPHSESFGYQLGSDAYTANGASISLQKNKKLSKPVWLYNVSTNMIRKASLAGVKFSVLQVCGNYWLADLDWLAEQSQSYDEIPHALHKYSGIETSAHLHVLYCVCKITAMMWKMHNLKRYFHCVQMKSWPTSR